MSRGCTYRDISQFLSRQPSCQAQYVGDESCTTFHKRRSISCLFYDTKPSADRSAIRSPCRWYQSTWGVIRVIDIAKFHCHNQRLSQDDCVGI
jgi:hypothetical protein